ncbi:tyrosine recombinase XerC [Liberibacter crescens]|uniref:tyrosine recombinase XerC n=1 Tax=Liberibacter crescens TaxID=1273132 RepID=UPI0007631624|nr:tyrosine recombinase XerC [Liberibacter crescens]AMC13039.1 recombinase XerC [Liberibacter crescens]
MEKKSYPLIKQELWALRQHWIDILETERRLSRLTVEAYERDTRQFLIFMTSYTEAPIGKKTICELHPSALRAFISSRRHEGITANSLRRTLSAIRSFIKYLEKEIHLNSAKILAIQSPRKQKSLPKALNEIQTLKLFHEKINIHKESWMNARDLAILYLLYGCGLRISEALALTPEDIHNNEESLRIHGKGKKTRLVPFLFPAKQATIQYCKIYPFPLVPKAPIFRGLHGKPLNPGVFQRTIRDLRRRLGLPETTTPHTFRHSFATHLLSKGADLRSIQELLGHSNLSTTQVYTDIESTNLLKIYDRSHPRSSENIKNFILNSKK